MVAVVSLGCRRAAGQPWKNRWRYRRVFGKIGSLFGGILAGGGDVTPGRAYIVGEQRPELFVPKSAGTIVPNVSGGGQNKVVKMGGFHVHGVQDADSFKRSSGQLMRQLGNAVGAAQHRG